MHKESKEMVDNAKYKKEAIVLENIKGIMEITKKSDHKGNDHRLKFHNAIPYGMLKFQIKYKIA